jgi:NADPH-dependent 2,4-dienoyl-CoA reductase/sulfur reductase-like enzyme
VSAVPSEVVVVGGGPAGVAAAIAAATVGARVLLLDEGARPGGQVYRQLPAGLRARAGDRLGREQREGRALMAGLAETGVTVWSGAEVWGIFPERLVAIYRAGRARRIQAGGLVLAPGAYERPVAFPGWTLPGVLTAGGAATLVRAQRVLPGRRVVLAGTGPLLLTAAVALVRGGAEVAGVATAASRASLAGMLRRWSGGGPDLLETLRRAGVPVWPRHGIVRAEGHEGVERVVIARWDAAWRPLAGTARSIPADTLCLGYGLVPATELAQLAGCEVIYDPGRGGWVPAADPERLMVTTVPGVFVAGDGAGVAGVAVAREQGRLAGLGAARFAGRLDGRAAGRARAALRRLEALGPLRRSLERMLFPRPALADLVTDETVICRCEDVLASEVRAAIADGARLVTEIRAGTRCGMGLCQGRLCVPTVALLLQRWAGVWPGEAGRLTARPPVRPIPVAALADEALAD